MFNFGFIGCGKISRFHADVVKTLGHNIAGVSARSGSSNIDDFSEIYNIPGIYYDWEEMVKKQRPDALVVAVSWDQTEGIIENVISTGIPCLIEKPVALSSIKLQRIVDNTSRFHNGISVGYNRRFYDFIPEIQKALKEKELASIELNFPESVNNLIKLKSQKIADYILIYMSSHWLDLLMFLIGELNVEWMEQKISKQSGNVEAYNGILKSIRYGIPIHLQANFDTPSNTSITFNFHDSIYKMCPIEMLTVYEGMNIVGPSADSPIRKYSPRVRNTSYVDITHKPGFLSQMKHFIDACVKKIEQDTRGCTLSEALAVTRLCEEIESKSLRTR